MTWRPGRPDVSPDSLPPGLRVAPALTLTPPQQLGGALQGKSDEVDDRGSKGHFLWGDVHGVLLHQVMPTRCAALDRGKPCSAVSRRMVGRAWTLWDACALTPRWRYLGVDATPISAHH